MTQTAYNTIPTMDKSYVLGRISALRNRHQTEHAEKERIRMIMRGGIDSIRAIMAWDMGKGSSSRALSNDELMDAYGVDLSAVNLLASGMERTAQRVGKVPTLKAPPAEDESERRALQKRTDIVRGWDLKQRFELQFPQLGRWLPGYGSVMWAIGQNRDGDGTPYPKATLRDPYDVYPGHFGVDQQPSECAIVRKVPLSALRQTYPDQPWAMYEQKIMESRGAKRSGVVLLDSGGASGPANWEGPNTGIEVIEYMCEFGTYVCIPEVEAVLSVIANPLDGPAFVFVNRFSFVNNQSQYHHVIGLNAMMAKLNIMSMVASEDSVFRELNIFGEMVSTDYEQGRFAINEFERDARVERPTGDIPQLMWQQVDRLERQLRIGANYDQSQDGISPQSFATGQSVLRLQGAVNENIGEYHLAIRHGVERLDSKRLEWAAKVWNSQRHRIFDLGAKVRRYRPSTDIKNNFGTRRVYGAMATWDDSTKAVVGLQYMTAGVFSREVVQENVDNLHDVERVNDQITRANAERTLFARLEQEAMQNPAANTALIEIMKTPSKMNEILTKYFTPQEPQLDPMEQAFMEANGGPPPEAASGLPRPPASTVLAQVDMAGQVKGGSQSVGRT